MPTLRLALLALAVALAGCGDRAPGPSAPPPTPAAAQPSPAPGTAAPAPGEGASTPLPPPAEPPSPAVPAAEGTPPAAPPAPAGPRPASAVIREAVALEPGGAALALAGAETVIDPAARFRVTLSISSADARLQLVDPKDAVVPAASTHEVGATTELTLVPSAPLTPGTRYALRLDGAATRELHAAGGDAFTPATLTVLVAGRPPPPEAKQKPAKRKRR